MMKKIFLFLGREMLRATLILSLIIGGVVVYAISAETPVNIEPGQPVKASHIQWLIEKANSDFSTRWPAWGEVTGKPLLYTQAEVDAKIIEFSPAYTKSKSNITIALGGADSVSCNGGDVAVKCKCSEILVFGGKNYSRVDTCTLESSSCRLAWGGDPRYNPDVHANLFLQVFCINFITE